MWVYDFTPEGVNVLVRGNVRQWLISHRVPAYWLPRWRGWQVRSERVPDLLALAELDGLAVIVRGPAQMPAPVPRERRPVELSTPAPVVVQTGDGLPLVWGAA